jgi:hypothetical protein
LNPEAYPLTEQALTSKILNLVQQASNYKQLRMSGLTGVPSLSPAHRLVLLKGRGRCRTIKDLHTVEEGTRKKKRKWGLISDTEDDSHDSSEEFVEIDPKLAKRSTPRRKAAILTSRMKRMKDVERETQSPDCELSPVTVDKDVIIKMEDSDSDDSDEIEIVFCPPSSTPTIGLPTIIKKTIQELPEQRLGALDKVAVWLDASGDWLGRHDHSYTTSMSLSPLHDLAYTVMYGATVRKKWKKLVVSGSFTPSHYPGVQRCKVVGCQGEFEDGLEAFMHIRDAHLEPYK